VFVAGRPHLYCGDICRRAAEREQRQAQSKLRHLQSMVRQAQIDLAAFGHAGEADATADLNAHDVAERAVAQARGALRFIRTDDPVTDEFRSLYEAVAPLFNASEDRSSVA